MIMKKPFWPCPGTTVGLLCIALVLFFSAPGGCKSRVVYLPESEKVHAIKKGDPSPIDGYVISKGTLLKLYKAAKAEEVKRLETED